MRWCRPSAFAPTTLFELRRGLAEALRAKADKASADRRSFSGGWSGRPGRQTPSARRAGPRNRILVRFDGASHPRAAPERVRLLELRSASADRHGGGNHAVAVLLRVIARTPPGSLVHGPRA